MCYDVGMSIVEVSLEGYGRAHLCLDLVEDFTESDGVEVWRAVFNEISDFEGEELITVFFEMDASDGYEEWDLIGEAIRAYNEEVESYV